jgi:hypothetical protein
MTSSKLPLVGAAVGLITYLAFGLLPSMLYGGYAGMMLATGVLGGPLHGGCTARAFIVGGMVFGVTAVASLACVTGAVLGALIRVALGKPKA